ncbi:MAG: NAD-binding protein [Propionibacteriales bacterium]|nr:NAD-binding protein [Propionibacteriales bacterium]
MSGTAAVGFIGLGNMGGRMANRLVQAGYDVVGYDPVEGAAEAAGAVPAASVADVVRQADHVLLSLPDSAVVEDVVLGAGGILTHGRAGQVVVDLSTAAPSSTRTLHGRLTENGVQLLDAGVSGGAAAAEAGRLTLMIGGDPAVLEEVRPALDTFAAQIHLMGGPGSGHSTKLLNNFLNALNLAASSEVLVAARKAGLDVAQVLDVINASSGANWATLNRFPHIVRGDYLEGGLTSELMLKDIRLYLEHLADIGAPTFNSAGPVACFGLAIHAGYGDEISNRVVDAIGDVAGGLRLHATPDHEQ